MKWGALCEEQCLPAMPRPSPTAARAQADLLVAYASLTALGAQIGSTLSSSALDGIVLTPGVYSTSSYLTLGAVLTLDAAGDPNSVFIITSPAYLAVAPGATMVSGRCGMSLLLASAPPSLHALLQVLVNGATSANGVY